MTQSNTYADLRRRKKIHPCVSRSFFSLPMQPIGNELNTKGIRERKEKRKNHWPTTTLSEGSFLESTTTCRHHVARSASGVGACLSLYFISTFVSPGRRACVRDTCISLIGTRTRRKRKRRRSAKSAQEEQKKRREN